MSELAEVAETDLLMCDFANTDAVGKLNVVGGGIRILGFDPVQGVTARFTVVARVALPGNLTPVDVPLELALHDGLGELIKFGAPEPQPIRLAQLAKFERPNVIGQPALPAGVPSQNFMILNIEGLPVQPGQVYAWSLRVDADDQHVRTYRFMVAAPGGPTVVAG